MNPLINLKLEELKTIVLNTKRNSRLRYDEICRDSNCSYATLYSFLKRKGRSIQLKTFLKLIYAIGLDFKIGHKTNYNAKRSNKE